MSKHGLFDDVGRTAGAAHMPVCLCCGEDVDFEQNYRPVLPFCSHYVSERCRKCRTWVRVRKFQQDPTFNLIGRPRGPRMKCGWVAAPSLPGAICARISPYARSGRRPPNELDRQGRNSMRVARGAIYEIAGPGLRGVRPISACPVLALPAEIKPGRLDPGGWLPARAKLQTRFLMFCEGARRLHPHRGC